MRLIILTIMFVFLSHSATAKTLFSSWDQLTLVGGFKVPANVIDGVNTRYTSGSFDKRPGTTSWVASHGYTKMIAEYTEPSPPDMTFPYLVPGRSATSALNSVRGLGVSGVQWIDSDWVLVSGRQSYRYDATWHWVSKVNLTTGEEQIQEVLHVDDTADWAEKGSDNKAFHFMEAFGGGFTRIPSEWAATNTGGRTIGMAYGGYDVLNSPMGPSIGAFALGDQLPITLLDYPISNTSSDGKNHYEIRDKNYSFPTYLTTPLPLWTGSPGYGQIQASPPIGGPTGSVGYMTADKISSGAGWIDDTTKKGVVFGVLSPNGYLDYDAQGSPGTGDGMFDVADPSVYYDGVIRYHYIHDAAYAGGPDATYTRNLYVYDPDCLAKTAAGRQNEWECTPTIITPDFSNLPWVLHDTRPVSRIAGVTWDADRNLLWLTITQMHDGNKYAVLVAYKFRDVRPIINDIKLQ